MVPILPIPPLLPLRKLSPRWIAAAAIVALCGCDRAEPGPERGVSGPLAVYTSHDGLVIDVASGQVAGKIPAGRGPWGVVVVEH